MTHAPDSGRGRVSAAASAALGDAQDGSPLVGGLVSTVLSPRAIYAVAGSLGLTAAGLLAAMTTLRAGWGTRADATAALTSRGGVVLPAARSTQNRAPATAQLVETVVPLARSRSS